MKPTVVMGVTDSMTIGGYLQSGNGREWDAHGMDEYLEVRSVYGYEA